MSEIKFPEFGHNLEYDAAEQPVLLQTFTDGWNLVTTHSPNPAVRHEDPGIRVQTWQMPGLTSEHGLAMVLTVTERWRDDDTLVNSILSISTELSSATLTTRTERSIELDPARAEMVLHSDPTVLATWKGEGRQAYEIKELRELLTLATHLADQARS